jgi:hypothetical protein
MQWKRPVILRSPKRGKNEEYADNKVVECCGATFFERFAKPTLMN